jgi:branched-chain amino acid transport system ATP-binding protein
MTTVLETEGLTKRFGRLVAVDDVSVSFDADEITSIIGPNGAGKTTFYNLLAGQYEPTEGSVHLKPRDGQEMVTVTGKEPHEISRLGLSRAFQINNVFEGLSVIDNVRIARISREDRTMDLRSIASEDEELTERAMEIIELTRLEEVAQVECANLSHGDVRKVEIAVALGTDPSVVLLDEPTAGMNPSETDRMVELVEELDRNTDTTFVITEHDMGVVLDISDRILVLDNGALIAEGDPSEVMADERVREAYLGGEAEEVDRTMAAQKESRDAEAATQQDGEEAAQRDAEAATQQDAEEAAQQNAEPADGEPADGGDDE